MIRINARGINFKPYSWRARSDIKSLPVWKHEPCLPSALGFCSTQSSRILPSQQTPVVNEAKDWLCSSSATLRAVTNASRYDVSACDVLDAKTDFVLIGETLFESRMSNLPESIYWTVCVMIVYLVRCLSKYVLTSIKKSNNDKKGTNESNPESKPESHSGSKAESKPGSKVESKPGFKSEVKVEAKQADGATPAQSSPNTDPLPNPVVCVSACVLTALLVLIHGDFVFVTEEELLFHRFTIFYVTAYTLLFTCNRLVYLMNIRSRKTSPLDTTYLFNSGSIYGVKTINMPTLPIFSGTSDTRFSFSKNTDTMSTHNIRPSHESYPTCIDPPFYNLLAGVMQMVASRLYCGAETPYNPPLIFIIATRVVIKSRRGSDILRSLTILLDAFMISLICVLGFSPSSRYLIALFTAAGAAADVLV